MLPVFNSRCQHLPMPVTLCIVSMYYGLLEHLNWKDAAAMSRISGKFGTIIVISDSVGRIQFVLVPIKSQLHLPPKLLDNKKTKRFLHNWHDFTVCELHMVITELNMESQVPPLFSHSHCMFASSCKVCGYMYDDPVAPRHMALSEQTHF